jgi:DNA gyrase inhibitor GyrI
MAENFVQLTTIPVLRVLADWSRGGPAAAMAKLEAKLPSIKGRKFYGVFRSTPNGEEYFACVAKLDSDDPPRMDLETGEIPGGWYARRKVTDWSRDIGQLAVQFQDMIRVLGENVDNRRPEIEFYRSQSEMFVLVPVHSPK